MIFGMGKRQFPAGPMSKEIGRVIRASLSITEIELAKRIDVSQDTISRWLNGRRPIDIENLAKICNTCDLNLLDLVAKASANLQAQENASSADANKFTPPAKG
jgi:transcriptional regulator with XRE-family HTH domain